MSASRTSPILPLLVEEVLLTRQLSQGLSIAASELAVLQLCSPALLTNSWMSAS